MIRAPRAGRRRPTRRSLYFRPHLESLEARWVPSASVLGALRELPSFDQYLVGRSDDGNSGQVPIGFTLNFLGRQYDQLFVHVNGSVTFDLPDPYYQAGPLKDITSPIIAAYSADVDTSPDDGGTVTYARGTLDGHSVFAVTWDSVGYFGSRADKTNTFQLLLIDRSDVTPGDFDIELNYARVEWALGDPGKGHNPPRVGYSGGTGDPGTFFEPPGSGDDLALLDGQALSLTTANPTGAQPGRLGFVARGGEVREVREATVPIVELTVASPTRPVGTEWVAQGSFSDAGLDGPWVVQVNYGDGTPAEQITAAPDGSFELRHTFAAQSTYPVTVTVTDVDGVAGRAVTRVFVLPAGSAGKVQASTVEVAGPGETVWPALSGTGGTEIAARYTRSAEAAGEVSVFLALYDGAPVETDRQGKFLDIQVGGAAPGDEITLTVSDALLKGAFEFGYFDHHTGGWVSLLDRPDLAEITVGPVTGTMTVHFKVTDIFDGTVFTVSLPPGNGVTTTGTVQGPTASAGDTSGLGRSATFTSNTQLAVALTSSRTGQLAVSASAQGSEAGGLAGSGPGGGKLTAEGTASSAPDAGEARREPRTGPGGRTRKGTDDEALWQIIGGDEALLRLWVQGVDLTPLLPGPAGPGEGVAPGREEELEELEVAAPADVEAAPVAVAIDAPAVFEDLSLPAPAADEADESRLALAAVAVAGLAGWRDGRRRRRELACR